MTYQPQFPEAQPDEAQLSPELVQRLGALPANASLERQTEARAPWSELSPLEEGLVRSTFYEMASALEDVRQSGAVGSVADTHVEAIFTRSLNMDEVAGGGPRSLALIAAMAAGAANDIGKAQHYKMVLESTGFLNHGEDVRFARILGGAKSAKSDDEADPEYIARITAELVTASLAKKDDALSPELRQVITAFGAGNAMNISAPDAGFYLKHLEDQWAV